MDSSLPIRVFLVDDHLLFRMGLRTAFEDSGIEIAGEAGCASEFFDLLPSTPKEISLQGKLAGESQPAIKFKTLNTLYK